ncbi:MAG: hypothetical protein ACSHXK_12655 [Oceanococcus sp.]
MNSVAASTNRVEAIHVDRAAFEAAFEFVSSGEPYNSVAYICRETGEIFFHTEFGDNEQELPPDVESTDKYLQIPHKKELGLSSRLAVEFVSASLQDDYDDVRDMFRRRGAYGQYKSLLERRGMLEAWYDFEHEATASALANWCKESGVAIGA